MAFGVLTVSLPQPDFRVLAVKFVEAPGTLQHPLRVSPG